MCGALRTGADRALMGLSGLVMVSIALLYMREGFAFLFTAGVGAGMLLVAWVLPRNINDLLLRVIGLTSMIYVPYDIYDDTIARAHLDSDARMLAKAFGGTTMMWGGLWLVVSVATIFLCLRWSAEEPSNIV